MSLMIRTRTRGFLPDRAQRHVLLGRDPVADRARAAAEELAADGIERRQLRRR